jgi:hypothetical protein
VGTRELVAQAAVVVGQLLYPLVGELESAQQRGGGGALPVVGLAPFVGARCVCWIWSSSSGWV